MAAELKQGPTIGANGADVLAAVKALEEIYPGDVFARGYYYANVEPAFVPRHWLRVPLLDGVLHHDPRLSVHQAPSGSARVASLGIIVDVRHPLMADADVVRRLAEDLGRFPRPFFTRRCRGRMAGMSFCIRRTAGN
jgi:hypothetical protein